MKKSLIAVVMLGIMLVGIGSIQSASAQFQQGGVNHPGSWYVGEGLKTGDFFSYKMCFVDYKECTEFEMDWWIEGERTIGTEEKWVAQVLVYDGNKIVKGEMELGKVAPEPTGGTEEISPYRSAFKSSIVWLSAYATQEIGDLTGKGPKKFSSVSWGKIANIGGEQILPMAIETITVPEGTFETVRIQWKSGGATSKVWILDEFPFPIKASTWTHVSEGIPPQEYRFELLDYQKGVTENPFSEITATAEKQATIGCPKNYDLIKDSQSTSNFSMIVEVFYGPAEPIPGCELEWFINFKSKFDNEEFLNEIQYDIIVLDKDAEGLVPTRSIAQEEGRQKLFTPAGQVHRKIIVNEEPGIAKYAILVYGKAPAHIAPPQSEWSWTTYDIKISGEILQKPEDSLNIPDWVKNNAGWWASGQIGDSDFVSGIQFLINQNIMKIPPTSQGTGSDSDQIPDWIKNNADWWSQNLISDKDFVSGIQFLIENGIMKIS